jgi:hypothetical protein
MALSGNAIAGDRLQTLVTLDRTFSLSMALTHTISSAPIAIVISKPSEIAKYTLKNFMLNQFYQLNKFQITGLFYSEYHVLSLCCLFFFAK